MSLQDYNIRWSYHFTFRVQTTNNFGLRINDAKFEDTGTGLGGSIRFDSQDDYLAVADTEDINSEMKV